tara:strand:+ start:68 stop:1162 length:1095 start_codon:yes stop_codon:yes gene_type:complete
MGNSAKFEGYGCQIVALVDGWRKLWSTGHGAAASQLPLPFGIVTLASGGSEGHDGNMSHMRWSQTGNYGKLPNRALSNTFLAHAYDLGDPMDNLRAPCVNGSAVNASAFGPHGPCVWPAASAWNAATRPLRDTVFKNAAPSFMGGIHPRFKHEVGRRLALAFNGAQGPTIAGCALDAAAATLTLSFNVSGADELLLQWSPEQFNLSTWGMSDSSSLMVCIAPPSPAGAAAATAEDCAADPSMWQPAPLRKGATASTLIVDLANLVDYTATFDSRTNVTTIDVRGALLPSAKTKILAVRYGWSISQRGGDTCCPFKTVSDGREPCVPGSCPIITKTGSLPANPFYATIGASTNKCECLAPQTCST